MIKLETRPGALSFNGFSDFNQTGNVFIIIRPKVMPGSNSIGGHCSIGYNDHCNPGTGQPFVMIYQKRTYPSPGMCVSRKHRQCNQPVFEAIGPQLEWGKNHR